MAQLYRDTGSCHTPAQVLSCNGSSHSTTAILETRNYDVIIDYWLFLIAVTLRLLLRRSVLEFYGQRLPSRARLRVSDHAICRRLAVALRLLPRRPDLGFRVLHAFCDGATPRVFAAAAAALARGRATVELRALLQGIQGTVASDEWDQVCHRLIPSHMRMFTRENHILCIENSPALHVHPSAVW